MAKNDQQNQLNLTVVALVALVAIVGLVALVLNAGSVAKISTGMQPVVADNLAGQAMSLSEICNEMGTWPANQRGSWYSSNCGTRYNIQGYNI